MVDCLAHYFFVIFVNDLPGAIIQDTSISLYADDAKIYKDCVTRFDCPTFYDDFISMNDWFVLWQLKINLNKYEVLHIGQTNRRFNYCIGERIIKKTDKIRDLGLLTSDDLSNSKHCAEIARRAYYRLSLAIYVGGALIEPKLGCVRPDNYVTNTFK